MASSGNKKRHSPQQKENYKAYEREMRWKKNRIKNIKRHLSKFPNDTKAEKALDKIAGETKPRHPRVSRGDVKKENPKPSAPNIVVRKSLKELLEELRVHVRNFEIG